MTRHPISEEAVRAAMARRADLLSDRPDPVVLSEERLTRLMLEAAAPILAEAERERFRQQIVRVNQRMLAAVGGYYRLVYPDPAPAATEVPRVD